MNSSAKPKPSISSTKLTGHKRQRDEDTEDDEPKFTGPNVLEWIKTQFPFGNKYIRHFTDLSIDGPTLI